MSIAFLDRMRVLRTCKLSCLRIVWTCEWRMSRVTSIYGQKPNGFSLIHMSNWSLMDFPATMQVQQLEFTHLRHTDQQLVNSVQRKTLINRATANSIKFLEACERFAFYSFLLLFFPFSFVNSTGLSWHHDQICSRGPSISIFSSESFCQSQDPMSTCCSRMNF